MTKKTSRRDFMKAGAAGSVGFWIASSPAIARTYRRNEQLRIAAIGVGGRGRDNILAMRSEKFIAFCDVDGDRLGKATQGQDIKAYTDYRQMLEKEADNIDAVVISAPDHHHAPAAVQAMNLGKNVYCEKPLTHNVREARIVKDLAAKTGVVTQMGNQSMASESLRAAVEVIRSGAIGPVREVHTWTNRPIWPQGADALLKHSGVHRALLGGDESGFATPPKTLDWNLWLGPAEMRPYDAVYAPFKWRGWWDFGTGALGDMACHIMNLPFLALELTGPTSVVAETSEVNDQTAPRWAIVHYEFPESNGRPAVKFHWYEGGKLPSFPAIEGRQIKANGILMVGDKGILYAPETAGEGYHLWPEEKFQGFQAPAKTLARAESGHHQEWIAACKGEGPRPFSSFDYAATLTETVLLGNAAMRVGGRKLDYDAENTRITNYDDANQYLTRTYREGWKV
ncbi:MAG: Gfo/Idh/MocA family oxidoreductase [Planctomycetota bacterium]